MTRPPPQVLLLDYGDVLSDPYPESCFGDLARLLEADEPTLRTRYWAGRHDYDAGCSDAEYFGALAGRALEDATLAAAVAVDVGGWSHVPDRSLGSVRRAKASGLTLAVLSNMPHAEADAYEREPWAELFDVLFFSCRLGLTKPDPAIFVRVVDLLEVDAAEVSFFDDREPNVDAAAAVGLDAHLCRGPAELADMVDALVVASA